MKGFKQLQCFACIKVMLMIVLFVTTVCFFTACGSSHKPKKVQTFTITYETEFDIPPHEIRLAKDSELKEEHLPVLSCQGYEFLGWYIITQTEESPESSESGENNSESAEGSEGQTSQTPQLSVVEVKVEPGFIITQNITLTAKWRKLSYFIIYTSTQGDYSETVQVEAGTIIDDTYLLAPDFEVEGYDFAGWYLDDELVTPEKNIAVSEEGITLLAQWTLKKFTVTYVSDFGEVPAPFVVEWGTALESSQLTLLRGVRNATCEGWYIGSELAQAGRLVKSDITLTAKWSIDGCAVIYRTDHGSQPKGLVVAAGTVLGEDALPELTEEGYNFICWYNGNKEAKPGEITVTEEGIILEAYWEVIMCRITYKTNLGTVPAKIDVNWGTLLNSQTLPVLTSVGNEFKGWMHNGEVIPEGYKITSDMELEAKWEKLKCQISYETEFGNAPETFTLEYGEQILSEKLPSILDPDNLWIFKGWYIIHGTEEEKVEAGYVVSKSESLTAKWECRTVDTNINIDFAQKDGVEWYYDNSYDSEEDCYIFNFQPYNEYATYKWRVDGRTLPGQTSYVLTLKAKDLPGPGLYTITLIVTDSDGQTYSYSRQINLY